MHDQVERAKHGDADAFTDVIRPAVDGLFGAAFLVLRDREAAEDAVQEGLLRAWQRLPTLRDNTRLEAWVMRIVIRAAIDAARRRRPTTILPIEIPERPRAADEPEMRDLIGQGFDRLSPSHRAVLVLRHYMELSVPEIAAALDVPEGTVKSRLHHAARQLRGVLVDLDPELEAARP